MRLFKYIKAIIIDEYSLKGSINMELSKTDFHDYVLFIKSSTYLYISFHYKSYIHDI